jgi:IclR family transcriptional regulator, KDG regulon repressor
MAELVKSAQRAFAVFETFDRARRPLSLKEICAALDCAPSSGSALLKSLVLSGYLDYDLKARTYFPTMRIAALGRWVEGVMFGDGQVLRLMEHLRAKTGETIMLATQSGYFAQYVHVIAEEPLHVHTPPGTLRPLAASGVGLMLLSSLPDATIRKLCRRIDFAGAHEGKKTDIKLVMQYVEHARREGYVFTKNMPIQGGGVVAMLLPKTAIGRKFALAVGARNDALEEKRPMIIQEMRTGISDFLSNTAASKA